MAFDLAAAKAVAAEAAQTAKSVHDGVESAGHEPPTAGPCRLRLTGVIDLGKQKANDPKFKDAEKTRLIFEVTGPKHPLLKGSDGAEFPHRMSITESNPAGGVNVKSNVYKLMKKMDPGKKYKTLHEQIGDAFKGTIVHHEKDDGKGGKRIVASLKNESGYTLAAPFTEDPETGDQIPLKVSPVLGDIKFFCWANPSLEQWASIYIDGTDDAGKSKNYIQNTIKSALNWEGSPMYNLLKAKGENLVPDQDVAKGDEDDDAVDAADAAGASEAKPPAAATPPAEQPDPLNAI